MIGYALAADVVRERAIADSEEILRDPNFHHLTALRFPLHQIVRAHEAIESGKLIGKVVIDI